MRNELQKSTTSGEWKPLQEALEALVGRFRKLLQLVIEDVDAFLREPQDVVGYVLFAFCFVIDRTAAVAFAPLKPNI